MTAAPTPTPTVLVVAAAAENRTALQKTREREGFRVLTADGGRAALNYTVPVDER